MEDFKKKGYDSLGEYVRAIVEQQTVGYGILLELSEPALAALQKRADKRGYKTLTAYITALLESYALGGEGASAEAPRARKTTKR